MSETPKRGRLQKQTTTRSKSRTKQTPEKVKIKDKKATTKQAGQKRKAAQRTKPEKPDNYQSIRSNLYPSDRPRLKNGGSRCGCEPILNMPGCNTTDCLNFMMFAECDPSKCALKSSCENNRLRTRKYCKTAVKYCGAKGWGLYAKEDLLPDTLVIEYVGEIIDGERKEERLFEGKKTKKFYMMTLNASETIDATSKGNRSRFFEPLLRSELCDTKMVGGWRREDRGVHKDRGSERS